MTAAKHASPDLVPTLRNEPAGAATPSRLRPSTWRKIQPRAAAEVNQLFPRPADRVRCAEGSPSLTIPKSLRQVLLQGGGDAAPTRSRPRARPRLRSTRGQTMWRGVELRVATTGCGLRLKRSRTPSSVTRRHGGERIVAWVVLSPSPWCDKLVEKWGGTIRGPLGTRPR